MKTKLQIIAFAMSFVFVSQSHALTEDAIFPKGELSTVKNHSGNIWLKELNVGDSTFDPSIAVATYGAGAKLDWHVHPGGQAIFIISSACCRTGEVVRVLRTPTLLRNLPSGGPGPGLRLPREIRVVREIG
jgi:hypothetical protein